MTLHIRLNSLEIKFWVQPKYRFLNSPLHRRRVTFLECLIEALYTSEFPSKISHFCVHSHQLFHLRLLFASSNCQRQFDLTYFALPLNAFDVLHRTLSFMMWDPRDTADIDTHECKLETSFLLMEIFYCLSVSFCWLPFPPFNCSDVECLLLAWLFRPN